MSVNGPMSRPIRCHPCAVDLIARLTLLPSAAPTLLAGGLPRAPLPLLLLIGLMGIVAAALATAQLRRQGELARLRSEFVAGVSHELRTPLAQLRLFLDTLRLKRYDTPEEQEWLVGHLTRETTRLEHLVENVLAASRLDRGMHPSVPLVPLDLGAEVKEAATAFAPLAASRRAILDTEVSEGIEVLADQATLRQLVLNLLDNAVKFGPRGPACAPLGESQQRQRAPHGLRPGPGRSRARARAHLGAVLSWHR